MKALVGVFKKEKTLVGAFTWKCATSRESAHCTVAGGDQGLSLFFAVFGVVQTNLLRRRSVQRDNLIDYLLNVIATNKNIYPTFLLN